MGPRSDKLVFNSILNFRRATKFWLCLLETQVSMEDTELEYLFRGPAASIKDEDRDF